MKPLRSTVFVAAAAAAIAAGSLAGCQQSGTPAPAESGTEAAPPGAGPDAKPGMSASQGRLVLPVIAGRPAAVYFDLRNDGSTAAKLVAVHVAGAGKAEMHKTEGGAMEAVDSVELAPGAAVEFAPGGYHVMAFELADTIQPGEPAELTLTFSDGDKLSMPLEVETMGSGEDDGMAGHGMPGMHH